VYFDNVSTGACPAHVITPPYRHHRRWAMMTQGCWGVMSVPWPTPKHLPAVSSKFLEIDR